MSGGRGADSTCLKAWVPLSYDGSVAGSKAHWMSCDNEGMPCGTIVCMLLNHFTTQTGVKRRVPAEEGTAITRTMSQNPLGSKGIESKLGDQLPACWDASFWGNFSKSSRQMLLFVCKPQMDVFFPAVEASENSAMCPPCRTYCITALWGMRRPNFVRRKERGKVEV